MCCNLNIAYAVVKAGLPNYVLTFDSAFRIANKAQKSIDAEAFVESISPFFGPATGGTAITIKGRFLGKSADDLIGVSFSTFSATKVQWQSSTQITCITPAVCAAADGERGQQFFSCCLFDSRVCSFADGVFHWDAVVKTKSGGFGMAKAKFSFFAGKFDGLHWLFC